MATPLIRLLEPRRDLRQPRFEGYKLQMMADNGKPTTRTPLGAPALETRTASHMPFQQLKRRAATNQLILSPAYPGELMYFAKNADLWHARPALTDDGTVRWEQRLLASVDTYSGGPPTASHDLPSAVFASPSVLCLSSGAGDIAILGRDLAGAPLFPSAESPWRVQAQYDRLTLGLGQLSILAASVTALHVYVLILTTESFEHEMSTMSAPGIGGGTTAMSTPRPVTSKRMQTSLRFHASVVRLSAITDSPLDFEILCRVSGSEPPLLALLDADPNGLLHSFVLGGPQVLQRPQIPQESDVMDEDHDVPPHPPPMYAWTQTAEDITIHVTLPERVSKHDIECQFTADRVCVRIKGGLIPHPLEDTKLFSTIEPIHSFWTIEKGMFLTLYLGKTSPSRWIQLKDTDDGVFETLDPIELAAIRDNLDKFTSDTADMVNTTKQPTLERDDEEIDLEGVSFTICRYDASGHITHTTPAHSSQEHLAVGSNGESFLTKFDVDGVVYHVDRGNNDMRFDNVACFHAFAYIAASKRQKRLIVWAPDNSVIALLDASRHIYLYFKPETANATKANQRVVDLGYTAGDLLGAQFLSFSSGHLVLAVLTASNEIYTISVD